MGRFRIRCKVLQFTDLPKIFEDPPGLLLIENIQGEPDVNYHVIVHASLGRIGETDFLDNAAEADPCASRQWVITRNR